MARIFVKLASPGVLPQPDRGGLPFPADGREVETDDPFWRGCLADGSLVAVEAARPQLASTAVKSGDIETQPAPKRTAR